MAFRSAGLLADSIIITEPSVVVNKVFQAFLKKEGYATGISPKVNRHGGSMS